MAAGAERGAALPAEPPPLSAEEVARRLASTRRELGNRRKILLRNLPAESSSQVRPPALPAAARRRGALPPAPQAGAGSGEGGAGQPRVSRGARRPRGAASPQSCPSRRRLRGAALLPAESGSGSPVHALTGGHAGLAGQRSPGNGGVAARAVRERAGLGVG